jgi:hypothetical protein
MNPTIEEVQTIYDYWDGPKQGIANYNGELHIYEAIFDEEKDDFSGIFWLMPTTLETLQLSLKHDELWQGWLAGEGKGKSPHEVVEGFYKIQEHVAVKELLKERMRVKSELAFKAKGSFQRLQPKRHHFQVKWEKLT